MGEAEILQRAIEALENLTGAEVTIQAGTKPGSKKWNAVLQVKAGSATGSFKTEVKVNVLPANLPGLIDKLQPENGLLVAKYISGPAKINLEKQGINYLDMAGNCFIRNGHGIFCLIKGQSLPQEVLEIKHEAFHKNGIKLLYTLLLREEWVNEPYRFLAEKAHISASTIGDILNDLKALKFLWQVNERRMVFHNKGELLAEWVEAFNKKLKPKLSRGKFRFAKGMTLQSWKNLDLGPAAFWGSEPAANLLTGYLQPGIWTIYTNLDRKALQQQLQLVPDPNNGNVAIYSIFWNEEEAVFIHPELRTVSPLLVYADLIGSGDNRNMETANRIYEQYLKGFLEPGDG